MTSSMPSTRGAPFIRITRESPVNGWLPFLNFQIQHDPTIGSFLSKWFRKPANRNIILHSSSHHPAHVKKAVVSATLRTASVLSSAPHRSESRDLASRIIRSNGYENTSGPRAARVVHSPPDERKTVFTIPFVSDAFTAAIKGCCIEAGIDAVVVAKSGPNLLSLLSRNRYLDSSCPQPKTCIFCPSKPGSCLSTGVVYKITCNDCNEFYVGHTGRPAHARASEHRCSARNPLAKSYVAKPFAVHSTSCHSSNPVSLSGTILDIEPNTIRRKISEALFISKLKPSINIKSELADDLNKLALLKFSL